MSRTAKGTVEYRPGKDGEPGKWWGRITLVDKSRPWVDLKGSWPNDNGGEAKAKAAAKDASEKARRLGVVSGEKSKPNDARAAVASAEAMTAWVKTWNADREKRGFSSAADNLNHYQKHIVPSIGPKHVRDWTRDDMRKLSRDLDAVVQSGKLAWKSAQNVWTTATKMCDDAAESKQDTIKCRDDNPALKVRGPDRGDDVGEQYLYPSEFQQFIAHPEVPIQWKRVVALAVYMYPRDAELRAMRCRDLDIEHGVVRVTKAINRRNGEEKATKGRRSRTVPLEPAVVPLLQALLAGRDGADALVPIMPSFRDMARGLRRWLKRAGVERHELHNRTPTTRPIRFHDLRATGITWMAVRGDEPMKIQERAGHSDFETTQRYIRTAEGLRHGFGVPFPELPASLLETSASGTDGAELAAGDDTDQTAETAPEIAAEMADGSTTYKSSNRQAFVQTPNPPTFQCTETHDDEDAPSGKLPVFMHNRAETPSFESRPPR